MSRHRSLYTSRLVACAQAAVLLAALAPAGARADDLSTLVTSLYGGDGIMLDTTTFNGTSHAPHFNSSSLEELNQLGSSLSSKLGFLALNSTAASFTFDFETGVPVRTTDSLGPILAERAETIGEHRLSVGFTYARVDYKYFNGENLHNLTLFFTHDDVNGDGILGPNPNLAPPYLFDVETDRVRVDMDVELTQHVYAVYGNFGITQDLDVGIAIPLLRNDLQAHAHASIERNATNPPSTDVHNFADPATGDEDVPDSSVKGSASGIGDLRVRAKYHVGNDDGWKPALAFVAHLEAPTGDENNLLGTGNWGWMGMLVADKAFGRVTTYLNAGYQFVSGGADDVQYQAGFDVRVTPRVTTVAQIVGRWEPSESSESTSILDAAFGVKFEAYRSVVVLTNFIVPLNRDNGLRADSVWAFGFEYTFGAPR